MGLETSIKPWVGTTLVHLKCFSEGEQNTWSYNTPLWHMDYFKLKIIKAQQTQEEHYTPFVFLYFISWLVYA